MHITNLFFHSMARGLFLTGNNLRFWIIIRQKKEKSKIEEPKTTSDRSIYVTGTRRTGNDSGRVKTLGFQETR